MLKLKSLIPLALTLPLFMGCVVGLEGSGVAKTELRDSSEFHSVFSDTIGDISVQFGETPSVEVTIDDNLLPIVSTEVVDKELRIKTTGGFNTSVGLSVKITTPSLDSVRSSGVGRIKVEGLDTDKFSVKLSGVGSVVATGRADVLNVTVLGVGSADLSELVAKDVSVKVSGVGGAVVNATNSIEASTNGVGSIKVLGNPPERKESRSGVGSIRFE